MFDFNYIDFFQGIPPQIATMLIAMLPIAELRAAIPIGVGAYKLSIYSVYFWSVLGNSIPVLFLVFFWNMFPTSCLKDMKSGINSLSGFSPGHIVRSRIRLKIRSFGIVYFYCHSVAGDRWPDRRCGGFYFWH
jgi:hypothetical protein